MKSKGDIMWVRLSAIILATFILVGAFSAIPATNVVASEGKPRNVMLELITATWCATCPYSDKAVDTLSIDYGPERISVLQWHVSLDGLDTEKTNERGYEYNAGQTGLPAAWFDGTKGVHSVGSPDWEFFYGLYKEALNERLKSSSPISISISLSQSSGNVTVSASFEKVRNIVVSDPINTRYVLYENSVEYDEVLYNYVVRDAEERSFDYEGLPYNQDVTFELDGSWDASNMGIVVFVQVMDDGEVLQSANAVIGTEPTVTITTDIDGKEVSETITIEGTASGDVQWVEIRIDGQRYETAEGTTTWSFELDPSQLSPGSHTLKVRAYSDSLIYSEIAEVGFETTSNLTLYILVVIIIVVVLLVAAVVVRKKGKE